MPKTDEPKSPKCGVKPSDHPTSDCHVFTQGAWMFVYEAEVSARKKAEEAFAISDNRRMVLRAICDGQAEEIERLQARITAAEKDYDLFDKMKPATTMDYIKSHELWVNLGKALKGGE